MDHLILKQLSITRAEVWESKDRRLKGVIKFETPSGETTLYLNEELSRRVVELCAEEIASSARALAENIKADALAVIGTPALESPADEA